MQYIRKPTLYFGLLSGLLLLSACNSGNIKQAAGPGDKEYLEEVLQGAGHKVSSVPDAIAKADTAIESGNTDLAQLYLVKAYKLQPNNPQVLQKMADLYSQLRNYELAEVSLKLLLKQRPADFKALEQYGLLQITLKNYPDAEENLTRVIASQRSWSAYNGLGIIANLQGEPLKAVDFFKQADIILPNSPELLNNIGFALYSANKLEEVAPYYIKALGINPAFKKAAYNYALLLARFSNYEQAYSAFLKISTPAEAYNNTGYIAMKNGDYLAARNYLQEAIRSSPQYYQKANDNLLELETLDKQINRN